MDGAQFWSGSMYENKTPADYFSDPETGLRPGENQRPHGVMQTSLESGVEGRVIPPRFIWKGGRWKEVKGQDFYIWVVDGEGTPGNYRQREYILPPEMASDSPPRHPADWPKSLREKKEDWKTTASSGLPIGLRVRCVACGHFYHIDDLPGHAKSACPATQLQEMGYVGFVIGCDCHKDDLQATATVLPGFPVQVAQSTTNEKQDKGGEKSGGGDKAPERHADSHAHAKGSHSGS